MNELRSDEGYKNLRVTAIMKEPVILDRFQPLDGILGATINASPRLRRHYRGIRNFNRNVARYGYDNAVTWWQEKGWEIPNRRHYLPLAVFGHGNGHALWVYCSSWAFPDGDVKRGITYIHSRFDAEGALRFCNIQNRKIPTGKSELKSERIPLQTLTVKSLTWYILAYPDDLWDVLDEVLAIGKKRNVGFGGVAEWRVEELDEDRSVFAPGGELMRPVPDELLKKFGIAGDFRYAWTTYRPPYWDGRWVTKCAVAGRATRHELF